MVRPIRPSFWSRRISCRLPRQDSSAAQNHSHALDAGPPKRTAGARGHQPSHSPVCQPLYAQLEKVTRGRTRCQAKSMRVATESVAVDRDSKSTRQYRAPRNWKLRTIDESCASPGIPEADLLQVRQKCISSAGHAHFYIDAVYAVLEVYGVAIERLARSEVVDLHPHRSVSRTAAKECLERAPLPCRGNRDTALATLAASTGQGVVAVQTRNARPRAWPADQQRRRASTVPVPAKRGPFKSLISWESRIGRVHGLWDLQALHRTQERRPLVTRAVSTRLRSPAVMSQ